MAGLRETWERLRRVRPRLMDARGVDKVHELHRKLGGVSFSAVRVRGNCAPRTDVLGYSQRYLLELAFLVGVGTLCLTLSLQLHHCQGGPPPLNLSSRPE